MAGEPDWAAATAAAGQRRAELGLSQAEVVARMPDGASIDVETYRRFERNEKGGYRRTTLALISQALGWPPQTLWNVAHGISATEHWVELDQIKERLARLEQAFDGLRSVLTSALAPPPAEATDREGQ